MNQGAVRHAYLDRVRGLAVLIMIEAHVLDSWTRVPDRAHPGFGYAMMLGGMGPAIALAAATGGLVPVRARRAVLFAGLAAATSMVTPVVRATPLLDWLPDPVEWYFRPVPGRTNFTLFPC